MLHYALYLKQVTVSALLIYASSLYSCILDAKKKKKRKKIIEKQIFRVRFVRKTRREKNHSIQRFGKKIKMKKKKHEGIYRYHAYIIYMDCLLENHISMLQVTAQKKERK